MSVSVLKHGVCYRNHMVIKCCNCGCIAEFKDVKEDYAKCPECFHENTVHFLKHEEFKLLEEEIKNED